MNLHEHTNELVQHLAEDIRPEMRSVVRLTRSVVVFILAQSIVCVLPSLCATLAWSR